MKYYLINESKCWADEFDWPFFDILNEEEYQKYMYLKESVKQFLCDYYFGTNEGWENDDFDFLDFTPVEISSNEVSILMKHKPCCDPVYDDLMERLDDMSCDKLGYEISDLPLDEFKKECNKLSW